MKVVDASVIVFALIDEGALGSRARGVVHDESLSAPHLIDLEVVSTLRRHTLRGLLLPSAARQVIDELPSMAITRHHHAPLLRRCWELRDNVKTYEAAYVALAEALGVPLLTADARLAKVQGLRCEVELLT